MQPLSKAQTGNGSQSGEHQIFPENIVRRLLCIKAENLYSRNLADPLRDIDIRQIVKESNEELTETLFRRLAESKQEECKSVEIVPDQSQSPQQFGESKKAIDFERLKNLF